jgi:hypothetical protein
LIFGIPCAAWRCHASAQSFDRLDLAKNLRFLIAVFCLKKSFAKSFFHAM